MDKYTALSIGLGIFAGLLSLPTYRALKTNGWAGCRDLLEMTFLAGLTIIATMLLAYGLSKD